MTPSSTLQAPDRTGHPVRKSLWIPAIFVVFMLCVVVVNGTMMYLAEHTFSGLDTKAYYQDGIQYNATLKDAAASAALGWTATPEFQSAARGRHLAVRITDKSGQPVVGLDLTLRLVRPASTAFDETITLNPSATEPGLYGADIQLAGAGVWDLRFSATGGLVPPGASNWQAIQRMFVK
jgi:nitrogen fixation protein FixH